MQFESPEGEGKLLSIVIKAFNEEAKIGRAIESALAVSGEISPLRLEVVVADSCSSDRTVEISKRFPVRVVQFRNPSDRGCGAGVELGFQASLGEYVYLMDGDMALQPGFLRDALEHLHAEPRLAGVGGAVCDERVRNDVDRIRVNNRAVNNSGLTKCLGGGGLFRREAIISAGGYAAHQALKGYEEAELGMRLRAAGYQLYRLERTAVTHLGHDASTFDLLARHWRSRRAMAAGVLLRSAWGRPWFRDALWLNRHALATALWWAALLVSFVFVAPGWALLCWTLGGLVGAAGMLMLKRDAQHVMVSIMSWHYAAAALVLGLFEEPVPPNRDIPKVTLHEVDAL